MIYYKKACGLASYISKTIDEEVRTHGGYKAGRLDEILTQFLRDENITVSKKFKKGTPNQADRIRTRRIYAASKNFKKFKKWLHKNKKSPTQTHEA